MRLCCCLLGSHLLQGHIQVHRVSAVRLIEGFEIHTVRAEPQGAGIAGDGSTEICGVLGHFAPGGARLRFFNSQQHRTIEETGDFGLVHDPTEIEAEGDLQFNGVIILPGSA